jgi:hypothetical protein
VTDHCEALEAQRRHDVDLVLRHLALRVRAVLVIRGRTTAVPVPAEIRADDREASSERGRDPVPARVRLRIAVEQ